MANQEHLDILKQGVEVWNKWRREHPEIEPDLNGIDFDEVITALPTYMEAQNINFDELDLEYNFFSAIHNRTVNNLRFSALVENREDGFDLVGIDLHGANLRGCSITDLQLSNVDLSHSDLRSADLRSTFLLETDLSEATLTKANLQDAFFYKASFREARIDQAELRAMLVRDLDVSNADFSGSKLEEACFLEAQLNGATLSGTDLREAWFVCVDLSQGDLSDSDLRGAKFYFATLDETDLSGAQFVQTEWHDSKLTNCKIYGISAWNLQLENTKQLDLIITDPDEATITVDNLEVAQFIHLLLNNAKIRDTIDTIARKAVLILGRFTSERKAVLDAVKVALRSQNYLPIVFDFDKPSSQDLTETVSTLAHLSRFIIVDLTDPSSTPYEVATIASNHIRPIQALFHPTAEAKRVFATFPDLTRRYHWVLPPYEYQDQEQLLASLQTKVIEPAELKARELEKR